MKPRWQWFEIVRRRVRWFAPLALLALTPKCVLCVGSYAGVGAMLGFGEPEICGGSARPLEAGAPWLLLAAVALGFIGYGFGPRHHRSPPTTIAPHWRRGSSG